MKKYFFIWFVSLLSLSCLGQVSSYRLDYKALMSLPISELLSRGNTYYSANIMDSALICYTLVAGKYDMNMPNPEKASCAYALFRSGNIHFMMYSYVRAQDMYFRSLEISEECRCDSLIPRICNNLGNVYSTFNDYQKAETWYKRAYDGVQESSDSLLKQTLLRNLIGIYCNLNDNDTLAFYLKASEKTRDGGDKDYFYLQGRGVWNYNNGFYGASIAFYKEALRVAEQEPSDPKYVCSALYNLSDTYVSIQSADSAEYYLKKCADIAEKEGLLDIQVQVFRKLSQLYNAQNNADLFMKYTNLYWSIDDSIQALQGYRKLEDVEFLFEMNRIDKQIQQMHVERVVKEARYAQQRIFLYVVCCILGITVFLLVVIWRQKRNLRISYEDLFKRNSEIVEADKENRKRYKFYHQEIEEKNEQITQLKMQLGQKSESETRVNGKMQPVISEEIEEKSEEVRLVKYQGSSLSNEERERLIYAIQDLMENTTEFCNIDFTLEKMAMLIHSKTKYVSQVINETYGKNFNRFVNEYRIKEARMRLTNREEYGQYTVKAIAQSVGFKSSTNFNQLFKELTGITPSMYLNMLEK